MAPASKPTRSAKSHEYHPAFEEYCETIVELQEDAVDVIQARIADRMEISRPAVSEMIKRMAAEGLITVDSTIQLTVAGIELAESVVRRHRLAERLLSDVLGLSWAVAHTEVALVRVLGEPTTCPHGNPIPGSDYAVPDTVALGRLAVGSNFTVNRIPEELEFTPGVLDFLEQHSLVPGTAGVVTSMEADGRISVDIAGHSVDIGAFASDRILVSAD